MSPVVVLAGVAALAWGSAWALTPPVIGWSQRRGLLDLPSEGHSVHTRAVPRVGGVAVFVAVVGGLLPVRWVPDLVAGQSRLLTGMLMGGAILLLTGLADDVSGLTPRYKLLAETLAAAVMVSSGFVIERVGLPGVDWALGRASLPVTVLWIVGVTNAFNLIDGLDGLATGVGVTALLSSAVAALVLGHPEVVLVALALTGALAGFLRYNVRTARIFLGDSGSLFIGFMLAVLPVRGAERGGTVLVMLPLCVLAIPLVDTVLTIGRRWLRRGALSVPDTRHLHHRLLALGLDQAKAVTVLCLVSAVLACLGLVLTFGPFADPFMVSVAGAGLAMAIVLIAVRALQYDEFLVGAKELARGPARIRWEVRDDIHAVDLAREIEAARSLVGVQAALAAAAPRLDLLHMTVCEGQPPAWRPPGSNGGPPERAWRFVYPLASPGGRATPWHLALWCRTDAPARPHDAERVARVLAPALQAWLSARLAEPPWRQNPSPQPARPSGSAGHGVIGRAAAEDGVGSPLPERWQDAGRTNALRAVRRSGEGGSV
jgi:UDP-GlcNAc:undecaprenyl-phosphate GlcNAc-1-phosphate transferase